MQCVVNEKNFEGFQVKERPFATNNDVVHLFGSNCPPPSVNLKDNKPGPTRNAHGNLYSIISFLSP